MSAQMIYKYPFEEAGKPLIVPSGEIALVAAQNIGDELPTVWIRHSQYADRGIAQRLWIVATGLAFTGEHVGSAVCANGDLVWHIVRDTS